MVTHFKDYYFILGILKKSSLAEIRKAYLTLAMQYHPDRNKALDAEHKFKEIKEAYDVLSDSSSRNDYDKHYQSMFLSFLTNDYKKILEEWIPFKKRFKRLDEITQTFDFNSKYWGYSGMKCDNKGNVFIVKSGGYKDEWQGDNESPFSYIRYHAQHVKGNTFEEDLRREVNAKTSQTINNNNFVFLVERKDDGFYYFCGIYKCDKTVKEKLDDGNFRIVFYLKSINLSVDDSLKFSGKVLTTIHWNLLTTKQIVDQLGHKGIIDEIHKNIEIDKNINVNKINPDLLKLWKAFNETKHFMAKKLGRTQNIVGEYAELLVSKHYDGKLLPPSTRSADIITQDNMYIQVKAREVESKRFATTLSNIRSWDFDLLVFTIFNNNDGELICAGEIKAIYAKQMSRFVQHVNANSISINDKTVENNNVKNITKSLRRLMS